MLSEISRGCIRWSSVEKSPHLMRDNTTIKNKVKGIVLVNLLDLCKLADTAPGRSNKKPG